MNFSRNDRLFYFVLSVCVCARWKLALKTILRVWLPKALWAKLVPVGCTHGQEPQATLGGQRIFWWMRQKWTVGRNLLRWFPGVPFPGYQRVGWGSQELSHPSHPSTPFPSLQTFPPAHSANIYWAPPGDHTRLTAGVILLLHSQPERTDSQPRLFLFSACNASLTTL